MSDETKIDWSPPMPDDQMTAAYQSVQAKLTRTAGGEVRNTLQNFVTALTHDPVFAGDENMSDETKIDWSPPMPDDQMAAAYQSVQAKLTRTAIRCKTLSRR